MRIQPTFKEEDNGPYGMMYPEDEPGFTAQEYASIPPTNNSDITLSALSKQLEEALDVIIQDPADFKYLGDNIRESIVVIKYGYTTEFNPRQDCSDLVLEKLNLQEKWKQLDWEEVISKNFLEWDEDYQEEIKSFYKEIDKPLPKEALYRRPYARWIYLGVDCEGYVGGQWDVSMRLVNS